MRHNLVFSPICATCGKSLGISLNPPKESTTYDADSFDDKITGADKKQFHMYILPCQKCIGEKDAALKGFSEFVKTCENITRT